MYNIDGSRKAPADADKIKLGQKVEAAEARTGEPSALRLMAERGVEALRAAKSWEEAHALVDKCGDTLVVTDSRDIYGKVTWGGYLKDDQGRKVKLSALPKDCSYRNLDKRFEGKIEAPAKVKPLTANSAKFHARKEINAGTSLADIDKRLAVHGMKIEEYGKSGAYLRYGEGPEDKMKLSALGGRYSLSALNKKFNANSSPYASNMHEKQGTVNASSRKDATNHASERASLLSDRAEAAAERADSIAPSGGGEGLGADFYDLDFLEQIKVTMRVADAHTSAHVGIMRALAQAREAEQKFQEEKARANALGMALSASQHTEKTQQKTRKKKMHAPNYERAIEIASDIAYACDAKDYKLVSQRLSEWDQALTGEKRVYNIKPDTDLKDLAQSTWNYNQVAGAGPAVAAAHYAFVRHTAAQITDCSELTPRQAELAKMPPLSSDNPDFSIGMPRELHYSFTKLLNSSTHIDKSPSKNPGATSGKAPAETGLKTEKTAQAAPEQEKTARRKFSFGGSVGKMFGGGNKASGPATGPKA